jgi:DNA-binding NarL/FixJ family response regulator
MAVRRTTILVVDDDQGFREFLSGLLERSGFDAVPADSTHEALDEARKCRPDAAILDVGIPGGSGYGLCRDLRDAYGTGLPVIFVSGSRTDPVDRAAGMLVGGDDYLVKPVDPDELLARVRRLLERSRAWAKPMTHELSTREIEVLQLVAEGYPPSEIATMLVISPKTVSSHIQRVLAKLDDHTRAQAVAVAYEAGLIRVTPRVREVEAHVAAAGPATPLPAA